MATAITETLRKVPTIKDHKPSIFENDWTKIGALATTAALFFAGVGYLLNVTGKRFETEVKVVGAKVDATNANVEGLRQSTNEGFNAWGNETAALWTTAGERFAVAKAHRDALTEGQDELRSDMDGLQENEFPTGAAYILRAPNPELISGEYTIIVIPALDSTAIWENPPPEWAEASENPLPESAGDWISLPSGWTEVWENPPPELAEIWASLPPESAAKVFIVDTAAAKN